MEDYKSQLFLSRKMNILKQNQSKSPYKFLSKLRIPPLNNEISHENDITETDINITMKPISSDLFSNTPDIENDEEIDNNSLKLKKDNSINQNENNFSKGDLNESNVISVLGKNTELEKTKIENNYVNKSQEVYFLNFLIVLCYY